MHTICVVANKTYTNPFDIINDSRSRCSKYLHCPKGNAMANEDCIMKVWNTNDMSVNTGWRRKFQHELYILSYLATRDNKSTKLLDIGKQHVSYLEY